MPPIVSFLPDDDRDDWDECFGTSTKAATKKEATASQNVCSRKLLKCDHTQLGWKQATLVGCQFMHFKMEAAAMIAAALTSATSSQLAS
jgi:hypothetical protein